MKEAKPKPKKKKANKKAYYVSPKEFLGRLTEYYKTDNLEDELAESVYKIAVGLSYSPNFIIYSYKDEMIGDAVVKMIAAVKSGDPYMYTAIAYFTTIAYHAFINRIKKEKKYRETINDYQEQVYGELVQGEEIPKMAPQKDYDKELYY